METKSELGTSAQLVDGAENQIGDFRIARGGPFYEPQQRLGLLREQALHAGRRAAMLVGLAWGVPLVWSAIAGQAIGPAATRPFLLDLGAWARFFVAIGVFVLMERLVEERWRSRRSPSLPTQPRPTPAPTPAPPGRASPRAPHAPLGPRGQGRRRRLLRPDRLQAV